MPHIFGANEYFGVSNKTQPNTPPPRNLTTETGQIYDATATITPKVNQLNLENLGSNLNGYGGTPGWLSLFQNNIAPTLTGTQIASARALNPAGTSLYDTLAGQAATDLAAGSRLRPEDTWGISRQVRGDYANRGFNSGLPASQLEQAMQLYGAGQGVQDRRRAFASSVVDQGRNLFGSPEGITQSGLGILAGGQQAGAQQFDQMLGYGSDLFNTNYNATAAANIAGANNRAALLGGAQSY